MCLRTDASSTRGKPRSNSALLALGAEQSYMDEGEEDMLSDDDDGDEEEEGGACFSFFPTSLLLR